MSCSAPSRILQDSEHLYGVLPFKNWTFEMSGFQMVDNNMVRPNLQNLDLLSVLSINRNIQKLKPRVYSMS